MTTLAIFIVILYFSITNFLSLRKVKKRRKIVNRLKKDKKRRKIVNRLKKDRKKIKNKKLKYYCDLGTNTCRYDPGNKGDFETETQCLNAGCPP